MKKTTLAASAVAALSCLPGAALADLAFNVGAVSDYRYRGISQTHKKPALQGGVDFSMSGFYVGAWASQIDWITDIPGGDSHVEVDVYGGYKGEIVKDSLGFDVGVLTYQYPSNKLNPNANTTEIYGALTFGPGTLKYSHAVTNTFGNPDSKQSFYVDASATFDIGGFAVVPHVGYQKIKGPNENLGSYTDYSLTVTKDFGNGWSASVAGIGTNADETFYVPGANYGQPKFLGNKTLVVGVKYTF
jgi:uncharacterized protein (TIGR02001 family)